MSEGMGLQGTYMSEGMGLQGTYMSEGMGPYLQAK